MVDSNSSAPSSDGLAHLVYELLDAQDDTARLAGELEFDDRWRAHLDYLRALQRVGRGALARAGRDEDVGVFAPAQRDAALGRLTPHAFAYEACDIPAEMTIREFRALRSGPGRKRGRVALLTRLRLRAAGAVAGT